MGEMQFVMCGSCTMEDALNPYVATKADSRQRLLSLINRERCAPPKIADRLALSEEVVLDDLRALEEAGLVQGGTPGYKPAFAIFTLEDQKRLQPLVESMSRSYAGAGEQSMDVVRETYDGCRFGDHGFSFSDIAYILVGAYILDYGGLDYLLRSGYLTPAKHMPGGTYVFVGYEGELFNLRGSWMFGHNYQFGPFIFSGHGELPAKGGRTAFPEQAYRWWQEGRPEEEVEREMVELGHILRGLYQGAATLQALNKEVRLSAERTAQHLRLLQKLAYVREDRAWGSLCPVVNPEASAHIGQMVETVWGRLVEQVVEPHWQELADCYTQTAPAQNGVDIREAFNPLHHAAFEDALRRLMEGGELPHPPLRPDGARYAIWVEQDSR